MNLSILPKLLILCGILVLTGCKKFLEIEPEYKLSAIVGTSSLHALAQTTTGAFNAIQSGHIYGGGLIANGEFMADQLTTDPISDFSLNQLRTRELNAFNGQAGGLWGDGYRAINIANIVLEHLPNFADQDADSVKLLTAECLFIRGIIHFELVRMFAQPSGFSADDSHLGIPIRTFSGTATNGHEEPRSSVAEVYQQIISDLKTAEKDLPDDKESRASKWAAAAFLAKVYFQQNDYDNALFWCDKVVNSGQFSLNTDVTENFNLVDRAFGDEMIFQLINQPPDDVSNGDLGRFRTNVMYEMSGNIIDMVQAGMLAGDLRADELFLNFFDIAWYTTKYNNGNMNVPVVRLAELYLTRAQCKLQLGYGADEIRADYNLIRERAGIPADQHSSETSVLSYIIAYERNLELAYEGDRFHELKRTKSDFKTDVGTFKWNDTRLVYPIPQQEVDENPNMVQNAGY